MVGVLLARNARELRRVRKNDGTTQKASPASVSGVSAPSTARPGPDLHPADTGKEALVTIAPQPVDLNPEARGYLFDAAPTILAPTDRHFFVDDPWARGYCAACGLPRISRRHVERRSA